VSPTDKEKNKGREKKRQEGNKEVCNAVQSSLALLGALFGFPLLASSYCYVLNAFLFPTLLPNNDTYTPISLLQIFSSTPHRLFSAALLLQ